eukprot:c26804_g1_i2 orf=449-2269(+)
MHCNAASALKPCTLSTWIPYQSGRYGQFCGIFLGGCTSFASGGSGLKLSNKNRLTGFVCYTVKCQGISGAEFYQTILTTAVKQNSVQAFAFENDKKDAILVSSMEKPPGFGHGKVYDTSVEDMLLKEIEQGKTGQALAALKREKIRKAVKDNKRNDGQKQEKAYTIPSGVEVWVSKLPKKKNIERDLRAAFSCVPGLLHIQAIASGNEKTRDPICKGSAFLIFADVGAAESFMRQFADKLISFGKIEKKPVYEYRNRSSSTRLDITPCSSAAKATDMNRLRLTNKVVALPVHPAVGTVSAGSLSQPPPCKNMWENMDVQLPSHTAVGALPAGSLSQSTSENMSELQEEQISSDDGEHYDSPAVKDICQDDATANMEFGQFIQEREIEDEEIFLKLAEMNKDHFVVEGVVKGDIDKQHFGGLDHLIGSQEADSELPRLANCELWPAGALEENQDTQILNLEVLSSDNVAQYAIQESTKHKLNSQECDMVKSTKYEAEDRIWQLKQTVSDVQLEFQGITLAEESSLKPGLLNLEKGRIESIEREVFEKFKVNPSIEPKKKTINKTQRQSMAVSKSRTSRKKTVGNLGSASRSSQTYAIYVSYPCVYVQ